MVTCPWWEQVADLKAVLDSSAACKTLWTAFILRDPFEAFHTYTYIFILCIYTIDMYIHKCVYV